MRGKPGPVPHERGIAVININNQGKPNYAPKNRNSKMAQSPKSQMSWSTFLFILVVLIGLAMAYGNRQEGPTPHKPVPHSTISPEDVKPLPKEK